MSPNPEEQVEIDRQTIAEIRLLQQPAYGLVSKSPYHPISKFHRERLKELEHQARTRKLKS